MNFVSKDNMTNFMTAIGNNIKDTQKMLAPEFSTETAYAAGDVVTYQDKLYKFDSAHAAGAWVGTDATETTAAELAGVSELTTAEVNTLLALLD